MLVLSSATAKGVPYWQRVAAHEMWLGQGAGLLGIPTATVGAQELQRLLAGKGPSGRPLTVRPHQRRRQGWDLVFAAPKSVSLLASCSGAETSTAVRAAHREAVADAFCVLEGSAAWVSAGGRREQACATVAAAFEHLHSHAGQPHLHTHLVLPNLALREDGRWGCLAGSELWRWREALGATFQLALRARLGQAGLGLDWVPAPGGTWELAGVAYERAALSSRALATRAAAARFGSGSAGARRVAQGQTRSERAAKASGTDLSLLADAAQHPGAATPPPPASRIAVEHALAEKSSSFSPADVLVALNETSPQGLLPAEAGSFTKSFYPLGVARGCDAQVVRAATESRFARLAVVAPIIARQEMSALGFSGPATEAASRLTCSGSGVDVLPRAPWLVQAAWLDAARAAWQAAGMTVALRCPTEGCERRWRALTSLRQLSPLPGRPGRRVLVVDAADHLGPAPLSRLVSRAASTATKLVLVPGGTAPTLPESMARSLDDLIAAQHWPGPSDLPASTKGPLPASGPLPANREVWLPGLAAHGALAGHDALAHTASAWWAATNSGVPAVMVGLGREEVEALNALARVLMGLAGNPAEICLAGRRFAPGERVIALGSTAGARAATRGTVTATDGGQLTVIWEGSGRPGTIGGAQARRLGHAYATTPPYLRTCLRASSVGGLFLLGDPYSVPGLQANAAWVTVAGPGLPAPHLRSRWQSALSELAASWPDEQILARVGPRPLNEAARARWAELVARHALERATRATTLTPRWPLGKERGPSQHIVPGHSRGPSLRL